MDALISNNFVERQCCYLKYQNMLHISSIYGFAHSLLLIRTFTPCIVIIATLVGLFNKVSVI